MHIQVPDLEEDDPAQWLRASVDRAVWEQQSLEHLEVILGGRSKRLDWHRFGKCTNLLIIKLICLFNRHSAPEYRVPFAHAKRKGGMASENPQCICRLMQRPD